MEKYIKYTDKLMRLSIYSALFIVPLAFWLPAHESFELPKSTVFYIFTALALAFFIIKSLMNRELIIRYTSLSFPVLGLTAIFFLSMLKGTALNHHAFPMHYQFFKLLFFNVLLYFLIINIFKREDIKKLLYFIIVSHSLVVMYGLFQLAGVDIIKWVSFGEHRVYSTMGNPDYMSAQFTILFPLVIMLLLSQFSRLSKFLLLILSLAMILLIITAQGRGAWISFIITVFYLLAMLGYIFGSSFFYKYRFFLLGGLIVTVIFSAVFSGPIKKRIEHGLNITSDSAAVRLFYWESALQMGVLNPLFGTGIGGFSLNTAYYQKKVLDRWEKKMPAMAEKVEPHVELYTHNDFLQTLSETGFLGLGAFIWLLFTAFIMPFSRIRKEENTLIRNIYAAITASLVAYTVNALLNFPWRVTFTLILLWSLFAVFSLAEQKKGLRFPLRLPGNISAAVISLLVFIFSFMQVQSFIANMGVKAGQQNFAAGQYEKARDIFNSSLSSNPRGTDTIELLLYSGNAYHALNNVEEAAEFYNRGLAMYPYFIEAHYNVANVYRENMMYEKAMEEYNKVLALNPKFSAAYNNMANIFFSKAKIEDNKYDRDSLLKAKELYEKSLFYKPKGLEARYNLGAAYFLLGDYKKSVEELNKVLETDPEYKPAKDWLARMKQMGLIK